MKDPNKLRERFRWPKIGAHDSLRASTPMRWWVGNAFEKCSSTGRPFSSVIIEFAISTTKEILTMPLPDFRARSTSRFAAASSGGASTVISAIRSAASSSMASSRYSQRPQGRKASKENEPVVRQAMVCAGSLRVRSCKLLWKPAALQLMVTTTTSLGEDESHFDDCEDDSDESDDDDIDKLTTMARPNKTHYYSLVFCHRSLMGHARRERIELDDPRDPVELSWGEDGLLSTRFEFSIVYGSVGRRRTLTCRARDAKEYLQWTEALRTATQCQGKNKGGKGITMNRSTHARTITSSNCRGSIGSFFDIDVVEEQQQLLEWGAAQKGSAPTPTSPTAATGAEAIAPPDKDVVQESALKPVPAGIAADFGVGRRRQVSVVVKPAPRRVGTHLQRRKPSVPSVGAAKPLVMTPLRRVSSKTVKTTANGTLPPFGRPHNERAKPKPHHSEVTIHRPAAGQRRRRTSSAARRMSSNTRVRKISLSDGARTIKQGRGAKRSRPSYEKRPRLGVPSSPLAAAPVLGALPMLQSPSSLTESPFDFIDACVERPSVDNLRSTEYVNALVKIAAVSSARQRQQLLQLQRKESGVATTKCYGLPLMSRNSDEGQEDPWLMSCRSSRLNLDLCDFEDPKSARSNPRRTHGESGTAYLRAMECEL